MSFVKYHLLNIISVIIFSYILAMTVNQFIRYSLFTSLFTYEEDNLVYDSFSSSSKTHLSKGYDNYQSIIDSGFFKLAGEEINVEDFQGESVPKTDISELRLVGTITGPSSIARAIIKKGRTRKSRRRSRRRKRRSISNVIREQKPHAYRLWSDVYGYKLVKISGRKVYLKMGDNIEELDMYAKRDEEKRGSVGAAGSSRGNEFRRIKRTVSRSAIQQKVLNNIDNALKGLRAGPYRVRGKIEGYKLFKVNRSNILYKFGARSGDIIKRINGHPINSTQKLISMWESLNSESHITVDIQRRGKIIEYDFTIKE